MKKSTKNTSLKYLELAKQKEEIGEYKEALEYYKKSIEEDPENIESYFGLNLINSYIEMEKELKNDDSDNINKHIELFNIFNEFIDNNKK